MQKPPKLLIVFILQKYFRQFGYVGEDFNVDNVTEQKMENAIKNFQYFAHLPLTGMNIVMTQMSSIGKY